MPWYVAFDNGDRTDIAFYPPEDKQDAIEIARHIKKSGCRVLKIAEIDGTGATICGDELVKLLQ